MNIVTTPGLTELISKTKGEISRLDGRCDNLQSIGRYLALWNSVTGKPTTNPTTLPYTYKAGDYYRVNSVIGGPYLHEITYTESSDYYFTLSVVYNSSSTPMTQWSEAKQALCDNGYDNRQFPYVYGTWGTQGWADGVKYITVHSENTSVYVTKMLGGLSFVQIPDDAVVTDTVTAVYNYKPNGSSYNNTASTTVETGSVAVGDVYFYDGTSWTLQINHASESGGTWGSIAGTLSNQTDLQTALDAKAPQSTTYTKTEVDTALNAKQNDVIISASEPATSVDGDMWFDTDADGSELPVVIPTDVAAAFSTSTNYAIYDLCTYNGNLYRFTAAHSAGAWTGSDVEQILIDGAFVRAKNSSLTTDSKEIVGSIIELNSEKQNKTDNSLYNLDEQGRVVQSILAVDTKVGTKAEDSAVIKGVKVAGTDLVKDSDGKVDVPKATGNTHGVVTGGNGMGWSNGSPYFGGYTKEQYENLGTFVAMSKLTLENVLKGYHCKKTPKTTLDAVAVVDTCYYLGEQTTVSIVLPSSAVAGDSITCVFYSGSTATTLSISGSYLGTLPTPSTNQRVELSLLFDGTNWALLSNVMAVA